MPVPPLPSDPSRAIEAAFIERIGAPRYNLWFPPNTRLVWVGRELVVATRNAHFQEWVAETFGAVLKAAAAAVCGLEVPVRFVADPALFDDAAPAVDVRPATKTLLDAATAPANLFGEGPTPAPPSRAKKTAAPAAKTTRRWRTFAEFVVGPSNRVAAASAQAIAEDPGLGPNPLVLHGPVGTGKTHLLEAVYASIRKTTEARPLYVTAEEFTHRFVQSTRFGKTANFRRQFRDCPALLLDDLHFLATKKQTQEEFLHTLDALVTDGRQVVVTADCHPRQADELMPELIDRLLGGAIWGLLPPDAETRLGILRQKAGRSLPDDVLKFLAQHLTGNVRELEGAVNGVRHFAKVTGQPATVAMAREALGDLLRHSIRAVVLADVDAAICRVLRISPGTLQSKSRTWAVTHPRMAAIHLARKHTAATYGEIAKYFGVKQHSTAVAAEKKVRAWIASGELFVVGDRKWAAKDLLERVERELLR